MNRHQTVTKVSNDFVKKRHAELSTGKSQTNSLDTAAGVLGSRHPAAPVRTGFHTATLRTLLFVTHNEPVIELHMTGTSVSSWSKKPSAHYNKIR